MILSMASEEERAAQHRHRHKQRIVRGIDDELVAEFDAAAASAGSNRSAVTKTLWEWYARREGAELPGRPGREKPPPR